MHDAHIGAQTNARVSHWLLNADFWLLTITQIPKRNFWLLHFNSIKRQATKLNDGISNYTEYEGLFDCCACWIEWREYVLPVLTFMWMWFHRLWMILLRNWNLLILLRIHVGCVGCWHLIPCCENSRCSLPNCNSNISSHERQTVFPSFYRDLSDARMLFHSIV